MTYIILDFISANIIQKGPTSQDGVASQKHFIRAPSTIDIKGSAKSDFSSIIMVMGEAEMFFTWIERLRAISIDNAFVVFLYASYDRLLPRDGCGMVSNGTNVECDTMFIPNTTWTEGRNTLAGKAFKKEMLVGSTFDWWLFFDDDVELECIGEGACLDQILRYLASNNVPDNITAVAAQGPLDATPLRAVSAVDALFQAFRRKYVPYLLPYATLIKGSSEWLSRAVNFCLVKECFPSSVLNMPGIIAKNKLHTRPYIRGISDAAVQGAIAYNFCNVAEDFCPCEEFTDWKQNSDLITAQNFSILEQNMPEQKLDHCKPLVSRFDKWAQKMMT